MIINTEQLPDWAIYVMIGGGVLLFLLLIWAIEYILSCLTCEPCRKCYHRLRQILYILFCCCLCPKREEVEYALVDEMI